MSHEKSCDVHGCADGPLTITEMAEVKAALLLIDDADEKLHKAVEEHDKKVGSLKHQIEAVVLPHEGE